MSIVAVGLNHTTAPLELRERASVDHAGMGPALKALHGLPGVSEAAILSTCNRTDLYCGLSAVQAPPTLWFDRFLGIDRRELAGHLYVHREDEAVRHVMRVASGLDSMVLGEPQILGQLKHAYGLAQREGSLGVVLDKLFQRSFSVAKRVRTDTDIGASPVSVAYAAVTLAQRIFGDLGAHTALLIGAGETVELCARHLASGRVGRMVIANRTLENARRIATPLGAYAIALDEVPVHLAEADIVISSTGSPEPLISFEQTRDAVRRRKRRPVFMADLAVPHDIDRRAGALPDVYLYSVDDLADVIEEGRQRRIAAAGVAEGIIDEQVAEFMAWMRGRQVSSVIVRVRDSAARARDEVLARARRRLQGGDPADEVVEFVARTLTNKLLHAPSIGIRDAGVSHREDIVEAAKKLFDVDEAAAARPRRGPGSGAGRAVDRGADRGADRQGRRDRRQDRRRAASPGRAFGSGAGRAADRQRHPDRRRAASPGRGFGSGAGRAADRQRRRDRRRTASPGRGFGSGAGRAADRQRRRDRRRAASPGRGFGIGRTAGRVP